MFIVKYEHIENKEKNQRIMCRNFEELFNALLKICKKRGYVSITTNEPAFVKSGHKEFVYTMDKSLNSHQKKKCLYEWLIPYFQKNVNQDTFLRLEKYRNKIKETEKIKGGKNDNISS